MTKKEKETTEGIIITPKQRKLAENLVNNQFSDKPKTFGEIMRSSDYSLETSRIPGKTIKTKGVQKALMEIQDTMVEALKKRGVNPDSIAKSITKLLNAQKIRTIIYKNKDEEISEEKEDVYAIDKGITHALKVGVGGGYKEQPQTVPVINFWGNVELQQIVNNFEAQMKEAVLKQLSPIPYETISENEKINNQPEIPVGSNGPDGERSDLRHDPDHSSGNESPVGRGELPGVSEVKPENNDGPDSVKANDMDSKPLPSFARKAIHSAINAENGPA